MKKENPQKYSEYYNAFVYFFGPEIEEAVGNTIASSTANATAM